jgi:hypothetical protein
MIAKNVSAVCFLNERGNYGNHYFKNNNHVNSKFFKLEDFEDRRIISQNNRFFVWKDNANYYFSQYILYSGIGYTREKIVNSEFICSADEMSYILKKNKNNKVRIVLISNPYSETFLDRRKKILVRKEKYLEFIERFIKESIENNIEIEIDDEENLSPYVNRLIK